MKAGWRLGSWRVLFWAGKWSGGFDSFCRVYYNIIRNVYVLIYYKPIWYKKYIFYHFFKPWNGHLNVYIQPWRNVPCDQLSLFRIPFLCAFTKRMIDEITRWIVESRGTILFSWNKVLCCCSRSSTTDFFIPRTVLLNRVLNLAWLLINKSSVNLSEQANVKE